MILKEEGKVKLSFSWWVLAVPKSISKLVVNKLIV